MIATALAVQDATKDAVMDSLTLHFAKDIYDKKDNMDTEQFAQAMFEYSAHLAALTATLVLEACLTKSQLNEMMDTVREFEALGKDIASE